MNKPERRERVFVYANNVYVPNKYAQLVADYLLPWLGYRVAPSRAFVAFHVIVNSRSYPDSSEAIAKELAALLLIPVAPINDVPYAVLRETKY